MPTSDEILAMAEILDHHTLGVSARAAGASELLYESALEASDLLRKIAEERKWRSMDSAPTKGEIILKIPKTDHHKAFSCAAEFRRGDWYFSNCDPSVSTPIGNDFADPTGWQPLPTVETPK